jgi:hypothetical protein
LHSFDDENYEEFYDRWILNAFINKQICRCIENEHYRFGMHAANKNVLKQIDESLKIFLSSEITQKQIKRHSNSSSDGVTIDFINGSRIEVLIPNESHRGKRYHALAIDNDISHEIKFCVGYAKFIRYPCEFSFGVEGVEYNKISMINNERMDILEFKMHTKE